MPVDDQDVVPIEAEPTCPEFGTEPCKRRRGKSAPCKSLQPIRTFAPLLRRRVLSVAEKVQRPERSQVPQVLRFSRPGIPRPHQAWDFPLSRGERHPKSSARLFRSVPDDAWFSSAGKLQIPHFVRDDNPFQVASEVICRDPQGLEPASSLALGGTAEAVPFPFVERGRCEGEHRCL